MKAIIATAGYSTRFLPVCKSVPKPMLPILEVPIIHELVKECIEGCITDVILVTSYGNNPVEDYFDNRPDLENFLKITGKEERNRRFEEVFGKVNITCVRQNKSLPYGTGSVLLAAKPWLSDSEPFMFMYGDDMVLSKVSSVKQLVDEYNQLKDKENFGGVIAVQEGSKEFVTKTSSVIFRNDTERIIETIIEKPSIDTITSTLISYGRYLVVPSIFKYLDVGNLRNNELYFSEALAQMCKDMNVYAKTIDGGWLTTGDPMNYLKAHIKYALERDEYKEELVKFMRELV